MRVDFQRPFAPPAGAQEVVLVRHGSVAHKPTVAPERPLGRQNDPPLSDDGMRQAEAVAATLRHEPIGTVFVSPLIRARESASPLLALLAAQPVVLPDLREVELGDWEHGELARRAAIADPEFERVMREQRWDLIPNAETAAAFARRVRGSAETVAAAAGPTSVAIAYTHSAVIAEICRQVTGSQPFAFLKVSNGSFTRLVRMPDGSWVLLAFNETAHLPREWQPRVARDRR